MLSHEKKTYLQKITFDNFIVRDHRVHDVRTFPGVALLEIVYRLAWDYFGAQVIELKEVLFKQPISVCEEFDKKVYVTFTPEKDYWRVEVKSQRIKNDSIISPNMDENMECLAFTVQNSVNIKKMDVELFIKEAERQWDMDQMYSLARDISINHYAFMKTLGKVYQKGNEELMVLHLGELSEKFRDKFFAHPAFLDASTFSSASFRLSSNLKGLVYGDIPYIPIMMDRFCIYKQLTQEIYVYSRKKDNEFQDPPVPPDVVSKDITVFSPSGEVLIEYNALTLKQIRNPKLIKNLIENSNSVPEADSLGNVPVTIDDGTPEASIDIDADSDIQHIIISFLKNEIGKMINEDPLQININQGFYDLGLDSGQLLGLAKVFEKKLGEQIYPTILFEYSNIQTLSEYLLENFKESILKLKYKEEKKAVVPQQVAKQEEKKVVDSQQALKQVEIKMEAPKQVIKQESNSEMLLFEPVWSRTAIKSIEHDTSKIRHIIILFKDSPYIQSVSERFPMALVVTLDVYEGKSKLMEESFNQILKLLQGEFQKSNLGEILVQLLVVDDKKCEYIDALGGLFRTAHIENPKICSQIISVDGIEDLTPEAITDILQEEANNFNKKADNIHYHGSLLKRYVKSLKEFTLKNKSITYKNNGVYVITGGMGSLGMMIVNHITKKVKPKLALIGRSQLGNSGKEKLDLLTSKGAEVIYIAADIGNPMDAKRAFDEVRSRFGPINGVFHSAGVLRDQVILKKKPEDAYEVFNPKIQGLLNIDKLTEKDVLDFLVLFSSLSAVIGNLGQADYASANCFMDEFASRRQEKVRMGTRYGQTISINWPLWAEGGMLIDKQTEEILFLSSGLKALPTEPGLEVMDKLLGEDRVQSALLYGNKERMLNYVKPYIINKDDSYVSNFWADQNLSSRIKVKQDTYVEKSSYDQEDIAIIGLAGRYPMSETIQQLYINLRDGKDCVVSGLPKSRWNNYQFGYDVEQFYKYGGFIKNVDKFDPLFFNLAPRQAEIMDPQVRLFLETAWAACEDAGFCPDRTKNYYPYMSDKSVGVFAGVFWNQYELFAAEMTQKGMPTSMGITSASVANMTSYCMNFHGPSIAVDTMCSSSLTAIHLAAESIKKGECHYAIAGGVNIVTHPHKYMFLKQSEFLSSEGKCRSFGEGGDGYVPGEGVGVALLTTLKKAEQEGYHIYGVIKGSAVNHVGKTSGFTVPEPVSQSEVIADAIRKSGIDPRTISYIEAHGTGTSLGDPIEAQGLTRAFEKWTHDKQFCALGSIKSNIGHLEGAAGISSITKVLLQLKHREIFPSLHSEKLNPYIPFKNTPFYVEQELREWKQPIINVNGKATAFPRRAGVSAFGASGSNAHIILEEYIPKETKAIYFHQRNQFLVPISAKNKNQLVIYAKSIMDFLKTDTGIKKEVLASNLEEELRNEIAGFLSKLISVGKEDLLCLQNFNEMNVDYFQLDLLHQHLMSKFGVDIPREICIESSTINELVSELTKGYRSELNKFFNVSGGGTMRGSMENDVDIADLAFTLQLGRQAMESRVIFLVNTKEDLIQRLQEFVDGNSKIDKCYAGEIRKSKEIAKLFNKDIDTKKLISNWIERNQFAKIAELWSKGVNLDWNELYDGQKPSLISLPTYPFEEERLWITDTIPKSVANKPVAYMADTCIHPMVQVNTSNLSEQRYSSIFTGEEFFLADHIVMGRKILPGVAYLEMARVAVEAATEGLYEGTPYIRLKNIVWSQPAAVGEGSLQVNIGLFPEAGGEIGYEVYGECNDGESDTVVYSQGSASICKAAEAPVLDLADLSQKCNLGILTSEECYEAFKQKGIEYGPAQMGVEEIRTGNGMVLAKLALPSVIATTENQYVLHPSLMDSALQSSIGLFIQNGETKPLLPFAMDELEVFGKCTDKMWAFITRIDNKSNNPKFNIEICDDTGKLRVRIKGISGRTMDNGIPDQASYKILMLKPEWKEKVAEQKTAFESYGKHVVMLCDIKDTIKDELEPKLKDISAQSSLISLQFSQEDLGERFKACTTRIFDEIQGILKEHSKDKTLIQVVVSKYGQQQLYQGLAGLLKTAALENPTMAAQLIEIEQQETAENLLEKLKENSQNPEDKQISYRNGKRYIEALSEMETTTSDLEIPWKDKGVYIITGGAGGLGLIFAEEIARKAKDASIILTGRSKLGKEKQEKLKKIESMGSQVEYRQLDITNKEDVNNLIQQIVKDHGKINGIIHSAGVINDSFIIKKTKDELINVLNPKVQGLVNLDESTKKLTMDCFIVFSSGAGVIGNAGQADYAAANAFMDAYAKYRNELASRKERHGRTITINWPLWKHGGMHVDEGIEKILLQQTGMAAMETESGVKALYMAFASDSEQVMVLEGRLKQLKKTFLGEEKLNEEVVQMPLPTPIVEDNKDTPDVSEDLLKEKTISYLKKLLSVVIKLPADRIESDAPLEMYGFDSIMVMQMTNELEKSFNSLPKTLFYEYQNVQDLAGYFIKGYKDKLKVLFGVQSKALPVKAADRQEEASEVKINIGSRRGSRFSMPAMKFFEEKQALDVAIIGVSGRYPGAKNVQEYWKNLKEGKDCITEIPKERWDYNLYYDEDKNKPGKTNSKWGGFIDGVDRFDPLFFNISPREAEIMDPQERLFLECVYETLEDAGYTREVLSNYKGGGLDGNVGVFVGSMYEEYQLYGAQEQLKGRNIALTGNPAHIPNRISYFFNFHGPSIAVDTMCSSALTAIHLACQSIQKGNCELAVVGGVNVSIHPNKYIGLGQGKFVSSKGRCESFGKGGDGYVPGEGVGAVLLKPLSKAIEDGDQIYGVIEGTAINHGGKTNGYTVPNPNAQGCAINQALKSANIDARKISYIEAHGTGTSLGDPIEIAGLTKAFSEYTQDKQYCAIGSAKSNIGHCESAAGIAGITKVLLQMKHGQLVPSLHSEELNPNIDFAKTPFVVQQTLTKWERPVIDGKEVERYAGISGFGAGGSNAHVIIREYIPEEHKQPEIQVSSDKPAIFVLSAKNEIRLKEYAKRILAAIKDGQITDENLADMAYTLQTGREAMEERIAMLVGSIAELEDKLNGFIEGQERVQDLYRGQVKRNKETVAVFAADEELKEAIEKWIDKRKYEKLIDLWVKGLVFDWNKLYGKARPKHISLPTYPFEEEICWISIIEGDIGGNGNANIHPMVQVNTSDLSEQRYSSTFTGEEFFIADHVVKGIKILPGVAYLEMARAAVEAATKGLYDGALGIRLKNIVWSQPAVVGEEPLKVNIGLFPEAGGEIGFEIYGECKDGESDAPVYSQGNASIYKAVKAPVLDLEECSQKCDLGVISSEKCYEAFKRIGIEYGPRQMGIEEIRTGDGMALAKLVLPAAVTTTENQYILHPSLVDSALQSAIGLFKETGETKPLLPFAMDELEIFGKCTDKMWAFLTRIDNMSNNSKFNIEICDDTGKLRVRIKGISVRPMDNGISDQASHKILMLKPEWKEKVSEQKTAFESYGKHVVMLCDIKDTIKDELEPKLKDISAQSSLISLQFSQEDLGERFQACTTRIFEEIQGILKEHLKDKTLVQVVISEYGQQHLYQGLAGLLKTTVLENPMVTAQLIEIEQQETAENLLEKLKENSHNPEDKQISYRDGKRYIAALSEIETTTSALEIPWKDKGVYLITGGAGGLGLIFAEEIAEKAKDTSIILTGRSQLGKEKQEKLKKIESLGSHVEYQQLDIIKKADVDNLIQQIVKDHGKINGIIHSAGVINDSFIIKKTKDELINVLNPKVQGLVNLDESTKKLTMDFFIVFSSGAGVMGNVGQADYAAANAFMDAYVKYRNELVSRMERQGRTVGINWPLWKHGGMHVDEEFEKMLLLQTGMAAMETESGVKALYMAFASNCEQVMVLEGRLKQLKKTFLGEECQETVTEPIEEETKGIPDVSADILKEKTVRYLKKLLSTVIKLPADRIETDAPLEMYGIDSVMVMQMTNELEKNFNSLPKTLFYEYQNIQDLAGYFVKGCKDKLKVLLGMEGKPLPVKAADRQEETSEVKINISSRRGSRFSMPAMKLLEEKTTLDVAIIGVSGRYPGAKNVQEFWKNLKEGKDCITEIPKERWDYNLYFDEDKNKPGKTCSKWGGFIDGVDRFDPLFFNISPREAELMDPQEKLFLQCVYETLEDAGYTREVLSTYKGGGLDGNVGVFVGSMYEEYQLYGAQEQLKGRNIALTGNPAHIANRISYFFNFHGPSIALDTMCSSALTAIHLACQSIQKGGCELAVVGGVNVSVHPNKYIALGQGKFVSSKGRCESFGKGGDGYVPGEGVGAVLLKPLSKAIEDGDQIYGVIEGTAINHGGKTNGYTVPNPNAQGCAIGQALKVAGVDARKISYIEAHGTGTSLGDPIEIAGLTKAFSEYTQDKQYCAIGSAKSNIGHCEGAAGIAGITKVLLQMKYGQLVPSLHSEELNPNIDFTKTPFVVQQTLSKWDRPVIDGKEVERYAGISGFGAGGSNAHVIIREYIPEEHKQPEIQVSSDKPAIFVLSAKNEIRLKEYAKRILAAIKDEQITDENLADMAYTLQTGREALEERIAMVIGSIAELEQKLNSFIEGQEEVQDLYRGQVKRNKETVAVFAADEELKEAIEKWIDKKKYEKLIDLWVKGLVFDWNKLYGKARPRHISLPTYPFEEEICWISMTDVDIGGNGNANIHPMVQVNTSKLSEQRYSSTFTGEEFFLADHVVKGRKILPGVAYLEMARAAIEAATEGVYGNNHSIQLKDIIWLHPAAVDENLLQIHIGLFPEDSGEIGFEIYGDCNDEESDTVVYSQGSASICEEVKAPVLDLEKLSQKCSLGVLPSDKCYEAFKRMGIEYGPGYQAIQNIYVGTNEALAELVLPASTAYSSSKYIIHPSIVDAALQSQLGLFMGEELLAGVGENHIKPVLLFAMQELEIYKGCTSKMWAFIHYSDDMSIETVKKAGTKILKLDLDLCDETGAVCMRMKGISSRTLESVEKTGNEACGEEVFTLYTENYKSCIENIKNRLKSKLSHEGIQELTKQIDEKAIGNLIIKVQQDLMKTASDLFNLKVEDMDADNDISDYGFDLFKRTELANKINQDYQLELNPMILSEYSTFFSLAEYLVKKFGVS